MSCPVNISRHITETHRDAWAVNVALTMWSPKDVLEMGFSQRLVKAFEFIMFPKPPMLYNFRHRLDAVSWSMPEIITDKYTADDIFKIVNPITGEELARIENIETDPTT